MILAAGTARAEAPVPLATMLDAAEQNLARGQLERAYAELQQAQKSYPNEGKVDFDLGLYFARKEQGDEAVKAFSRAIEKKPELHDAYLNLALQQDVLGRHDDAGKTYAAGTQRFAQDVELWHEWGTNLIIRGKFADAEKALEKARALDAKDPMILADLGYCALKQKRGAEAVKLYEQAHVDDPEVRKQYADALALDGQLKKAEAVLSELLAKAPADPELLHRRMRVREALGDKSGAAADKAQLAKVKK